jgi:hypothetical protein
METKQLQYILEQHKLWLFSDDGKRADLSNADLRGADLRGADLCSANLRGADLRGAILSNAALYSASLCGADLRGADLCNADLSNANLSGAKLPFFQIVPCEGSFTAWKKTSKGVIKILIPARAKRTSSLIGRRCRAEFVKVLSGPGCGGSSPTYHEKLIYNKGELVYADSFNPDIRLECTNGIHFYMTREEAEEY